MNQHILLTGATGMLGKDLIQTLLKRGDRVSILSRKPHQMEQVKVFLWDADQQKIDTSCLEGIDSIIHLAGENISKGKWTDQRKKEIIDSRVLSAQLLFKTLATVPNQVKNFISAAAVGYYGNRGDELLTEESTPGHNFLAECCIQWEKAIDQGQQLNLRIVKIRTGVVLAKNDGALKAMATPISLFAGAPLGSGKQWIPWIHYQDMTRIYLHALDNDSLTGVYNAAAPFPVTNKEMTKAIARQLHRPVWPFNVPEKILQLILGEMSSLVLNSTHTTAQKLESSGFIFKYTQLEQALSDIYGS
ncbi:TIGR01777 family oxidoreductase [Pedobacter sp. WC2423]|uniref:TIGR01777 family oxidoreductase n=1 Tax=Pedobacter sp. WC2423 TaxID=3234142 RepID=UPI003466AED6